MRPREGGSATPTRRYVAEMGDPQMARYDTRWRRSAAWRRMGQETAARYIGGGEERRAPQAAEARLLARKCVRKIERHGVVWFYRLRIVRFGRIIC